MIVEQSALFRIGFVFIALAVLTTGLASAQGVTQQEVRLTLKGSNLPAYTCAQHLLQTPDVQTLREILDLDQAERDRLSARQADYESHRNGLAAHMRNRYEALGLSDPARAATIPEQALRSYSLEGSRRDAAAVRRLVASLYRGLDDESRALMKAEFPGGRICEGVALHTTDESFDPDLLDLFDTFRDGMQEDFDTTDRGNR